MAEKMFVVTIVARQIEGEYVFVRQEKAFYHMSNAEAHAKSLKKQFSTPDGKTIPQNITTPHGNAECSCDVGIFEVAIADKENNEQTT
jgi:hypothetical protein